ncbi:MAG TPA: D-alanyl-D-alanine carboxypeptidase/D-alanyl-D-alanine-endopeptidase [Longimicrobiales bacterium]|nr:D-alanyl-D-alanine carboxypeptidase/D-alanyl-D-alanine-endopeptidase [Longimicrobiales bacterium]
MRRGAGPISTLAVAFFLAVAPPALGDGPPLNGSVVELRAEVDEVLSRGRYASATWGVLAISLDRGDTLLVRNPDLPMLPASNLKVVTSAAALHRLGSDYRYTTWLLTNGAVQDGVLDGDLILYGTGDPGFSERYHLSAEAPLEALVEQLEAAGIRQIEGRVVGDGSLFPGRLIAEGWEPTDLNEWFTAPSGALAYHENIVAVRVSPGEIGGPPDIVTVPPHVGLVVANEATTVTGRARRPLWLLRDSPDEPIRAVGEISSTARDIWREMTVRNPALAASHALTHVLRSRGIVVRGFPSAVEHAEESTITPGRVWTGDDSVRVLATFRSPPLADYLRAVNQRSHNLYADLMLRTLGHLDEGDGSFAGGGRAVKRFLVETVGVPEGQVDVADGSGLSSLNRVSPGALVATLRYMEGTPQWAALWETLPEAGSRELFRRMIRTPAAGNLRAKTGTMHRVSGLTGLVTTASGERVVFSILGNDLPSETGAKRLEDRIGVLLAEWER